MFVEVMPVDDLPEGSMASAEAGDLEILLARVDGRVYAVDNVCTHAEGWLDLGELHPETCEVQCPLHDGRFRLDSGAPTREPCTVPIGSYAVELRDEAIFVDTSKLPARIPD